MIYWPKQADEFTMRIPNATGYPPVAGDQDLWLEVRNNVGLQVTEGVWEPSEISPLYFVAFFTDWEAGLPEGEYTYALRLGAGGVVLSEGLLIVGDYKADSKEYEKTIEYEQYER